MEPTAKPQDEIKARLEVAQLYEEMGQKPKAARYYLAAAEIALRAKLYDQGKSFLEKTLVLDPESGQARTYLDKLTAHMAAASGGVGALPPTRVENQAASDQGLCVPTPSVYLRKDQIAAILAQVASAPNSKFFPFDPLPKVDQSAIERKAKEAQSKRDEQMAKERTVVESSFGRGPSSFSSGGGRGLFGASEGRSRREREETPSNSSSEDKGRRRARGTNEGLADSILRKMREG